MGGINVFDFKLAFKYLSLLPLVHAAHPLTNIPALNPTIQFVMVHFYR
jgi:hypothetical protein